MSSPVPTPSYPPPTDPLEVLKTKVAALEAELNKSGLFKRIWAKLVGYKTVVFGSLVGVVPAILDFFSTTEWGSLGITPITGVLIGAAIVALRVLTKGPIFRGQG